MKLNEYGEWTDKVWKSGQPASKMTDTDLAITALGLSGETGEALEYFKKYLRDGKDLTDKKINEELALELGDVLYYWVRLCRYIGRSPKEVMMMNHDKLSKRHAKRLEEAANG